MKLDVNKMLGFNNCDARSSQQIRLHVQICFSGGEDFAMISILMAAIFKLKSEHCD